jgi:hypothetical protein
METKISVEFAELCTYVFYMVMVEIYCGCEGTMSHFNLSYINSSSGHTIEMASTNTIISTCGHVYGTGVE